LVDFTIITPVRNGAATIRDCVKSVCNQTIRAQHIIVDGFSTDATMDIIKAHYADCTETLSESDDGIYDAMNKGLQMALGDVIGILNSDDFYASSDVLESVSRVFDDNRVDSCYGDLVYVDRKDPRQIIRYWQSGGYKPNFFYNGWMPPHPTFFVRRDVYAKYGNFNLSVGTSADYEIMLRFLLKKNISVAYLAKILVYMRTGGASCKSLWRRIHANITDRKAWRVNQLHPHFWTLWMKPLRKLPQYIRRPM
jgi:glycosyltransferase involved in cell wall biosynthesis